VKNNDKRAAHMLPPISRSALALAVLAALSDSAVVQAQMVFDGTVGAPGAVPFDIGTNTFTIDDNRGTVAGTNLFHSFDAFNVLQGQTARFRQVATPPGSIANVISRVTGGVETTIDGIVRSEIPGADFWFVNPAGVIVGSGARFDVTGTLALGAADSIQFANGASWYALGAPPGASSVLSVAAPTAFGFVPGSLVGTLELNNVGLVEVDNLISSYDPMTNDIGDIVLAGDNVAIANSDVETFGFVRSGTARDAGDVRITADQTLTLSQRSRVATGNESQVPGAPSAAAGNVFLRAGNIVLTGGAQVRADTRARTAETAQIALDATDITISGVRIDNQRDGTGFNLSSLNDASNPRLSIVATDDLSASSATIVSQNQSGSSGAANALQLMAGDQLVLLDSEVRTASDSSEGLGSVGEIDIAAPIISILNSDVITNTFGQAPSANLVVDASGSATISGSQLSASTYGSGAGGTVSISAPTMTFGRVGDTVPNGGALFAFSAGSGRGGDIRITVPGQLTIYGGFVTAEANRLDPAYSGGGSAGNIRIDAGDVLLVGAQLVSSTREEGDAGNVKIQATRTIEAREGTYILANVFTDELGEITGVAGDIEISAPIVVFDGARLEAATDSSSPTEDAGSIIVSGGSILVGDSVVTTSTSGDAAAGDIQIEGDEIRIDDGSTLTSESQTTASGSAGSVTITGGSIRLANATIRATTESRRAGNDVGNIAIGTSASDVGLIGTSVLATTRGSTAAGKINISGAKVALDRGTVLNVQTFDDGDAGDIAIAGGVVTTNIVDGDPDFELTSRVTITSRSQTDQSGSAGTVTIGGSRIELANAEISATTESSRAGNDAGNVAIGTGASDVRLINTNVLATTGGSTAAGDIDVTGAIIAVDDGTQLNVQTSDIGDAGDITIAGGVVTSNIIDGSPDLDSTNRVRITSRSATDDSGSAGTVMISGSRIELANAEVSATTESSQVGNAVGNLRIGTDVSDVRLIGAQVLATTRGATAAGEINISGASVALEGTELNVQTFDAGDAGDITITGGVIASNVVDGSPNLHPDALVRITSRSETDQSGSAGTVTLAGGRIELANTEISATTESSRVGNDVGNIAIGSGVSDVTFIGTSVLATTSGSTAAGDIDIAGATVALNDGTNLNAQTFDLGGAGDITITGGTVTSNYGSDGAIDSYLASVEISSRSETPSSGAAGNVTVRGAHIRLANAHVSATTESDREENAVGDIRIGDASDAIQDDIELTNTTVDVTTFGRSGAGSISLDGPRIALSDATALDAQTYGEGRAGNISITGGTITSNIGPDGNAAVSVVDVRISSRSEMPNSGPAGTVAIRGGQVRLANTQITAETNSANHAGAIGLMATGADQTGRAALEILGTSTLSSDAEDGLGADAGGINLIAQQGSIRLAGGAETPIRLSTAAGPAAGSAGSITFTGARGIELSNATVTTTVKAPSELPDPHYGYIALTSPGQVRMTNALLDARTSGVVRAGSVEVQGDRIEIRGGRRPDPLVAGGAALPVNTAIVTSTSGVADAAPIALTASSNITLDAGVLLSSAVGSTTATSDVGNAGTIDITATSGTISVSGGASVETASLGRDAGEAGALTLRGASVVLNGATLNTSVQTLRTGLNPAPINIISTGPVTVTNSLLDSRTSGAASAGNVAIGGTRIEVRGGRSPTALPGITLPANTAIVTSTSSSGDAGDIALTSSSNVIVDAGVMLSSAVDNTIATSLVGDAGAIDVTATTGTINVSGGASIESASIGRDAGEAGALTLRGASVVLDGATLNTSVQSVRTGLDPAQISIISTGPVSLTNSLLDARTSGAVGAGAVAILGDTVELRGGRQPSPLAGIDLPPHTAIVTSTASGAPAGNIVLQADAILIEDAFISSQTSSSGHAGTICIEAGSAQCVLPAVVQTGPFPVEAAVVPGPGGITIEDSLISTSTTSTGNAGAVNLYATDIIITGGLPVSVPGADGQVLSLDAAIVTSSGGSTAGSGAGGPVTITLAPGGSLQLSDTAIVTFAEAANGGAIALYAQGAPITMQQSAIIASAGASASGSGGNVLIDQHGKMLMSRSQILAEAGNGRGGNISLRKAADAFAIRDTQSIISADGLVDGDVSIDSPDTDVSAAIQPQDIAIVDQPTLAASACEPAQGERSRFVVEGRGGVKPGVDEYQTASQTANARATAAASPSPSVPRAMPMATLAAVGAEEGCR
jgi:filamentous hemagglutinin family protein